MTFIIKHKWTLATWFLIIIRSVNVQIAVPMYPPPVYAVPPPPIAVAVAVPIAMRMPFKTTERTTTTSTTEANIAMRMPVPVLMSGAVPYPMMRPPHWPSKKPELNERDNRPPLPPPPAYSATGFGIPSIVAQPPVIVLPFPLRPQPPIRIRPSRRPSSSDSESSDTSDTSDSMTCSSSSKCYTREGRYSKRHRGIKKRLFANRRHLNPSRIEVSDNELVQPVLSYISRNGDVKFTKRISRYEADKLLGDDNSRQQPQTVRVMTGNEPANSRLVVISEDADTIHFDDYKRKRIVLRNDGANHVLGEGKKQIVFKPPADKRISNLSLSFQII
ncbi:uncharacterized protein LOC116412771 [Galleria mellonella]|uniref:Uncharacterized protein LOC116412771 n=1 Tax=Galleria mellonella TaxID=7137 RepID=A0A6J3BUX1_GALME|nr:uncharacterized protein LOC116412771 [Galleria mellonella]